MRPVIRSCSGNIQFISAVKSMHFSPTVFPERYRRATHLRRRRSWARVFAAKISWILLEIEERFQLITFAKMLVTFLLALALAPLALNLYLCLKAIRATGSALFHWYFPDYQLVSNDTFRHTLDTKRTPSIVTLLLMLHGKISIEELRSKVLIEIVNKRKPGRGNGLLFPHLKMRLKKVLGCLAWEKDGHFDIAKHVTATNTRWLDRPINEANIQEFITEQSCHSLPDMISPWQVLLINMQCTDLKLDTVCVFIRLHHLVSEGMTLGQLIRSTLAGSELPILLPGSEVSVPLPASRSLQTFHAITETYSVFAKRSATKQTLSQVLDRTQATISSVRSKCDPEESRDDLNTAWQLVRKLLVGVQSFFSELQKLYEATDPQCAGRSAWYRAGSLVYLLPRLMGSFDWLWTISLLDLLKQSLKSLLCLPLLLLRLGSLTARSAVIGLLTTATEVRLFLRSGRPIYIMLKDACREIRETLQTIVLAPSIILNELLKRSDHHPLPRISGSGRKSVAWSEPLSLEVVRKVKEASGATTNEVLVSLCAGALTRYFRAIGLDVPDNMMTIIPVYSKDFADACETDGDGFVTMSLPTGQSDALDCLATTQRRMSRIRNNPSKYLVSMAIMRYLRNFLPDFILGILIKLLSRQYLTTLANISISTGCPVAAWGREVTTICYWRPPQANTALSLSLITYNNEVKLMAMSNQDVMSHLKILTIGFGNEFKDLARILGVRLRRKSRSTSSPILRVFPNF